MKRAKAAGLGLALLTGWANAAEPGQPFRVPPIPTVAPPAVLPVEMRTPDAPPAIMYSRDFMGSGSRQPLPQAIATDPVWMSARPATAPTPVAAAPVPAAAMPPVPVRAMPVVPPAPPIVYSQPARGFQPASSVGSAEAVPSAGVNPGPRVMAEVPTGKFEIDVPPLPTESPAFPSNMPGPSSAPPMPVVPIVPVPEVKAPPAVPAAPAAPAVEPMKSTPVLPAPKPVEIPPVPKTVAPPPTPAPAPEPDPEIWGAPAARPAVEQVELQPASPEVLHSSTAGVPFRRGTFGSPPIRLSRDYPPLTDLIANRGSPEIGMGEGAGEAAPATDRAFVQLEYLLWWVNRDSIPVLATTSNNGGNGYLGQSGTVPVIGPGQYGSSARNGFRVRAGTWLDDCGTCGVDGSFFFLGQRSNSITMSPDQFSVITRPFFAANGGGFEFGEVVSAPNFSRGALTIEDQSLLWGADVNFRKALCRQCDRQIEWFAGFRFLALDENIRITENIVALPGGPDVPGTIVQVQDSFATKNRFYGGQIGGLYQRRWGRLDLYARGSIALGNTHQEIENNGYQYVTQPGAPTSTFVGGLLTTPTNIGTFNRDTFSAVPEVTLNLGFWATSHMKLYVGYNLLYWPNVVRPGGEIDRVVNLSNLPNPPANVPPSNIPRPAPTFRESDLAIQGMQFGVEWRW